MTFIARPRGTGFTQIGREKAVEHRAAQRARQMVPLLGPVHAIPHERPSARGQFDANVSKEVAPVVGQLVLNVVTGTAQRIMAVAVWVVATVAANENPAVQQAAHDLHTQAPGQVVVTRAGRPQPRRPCAVAQRPDRTRRRQPNEMLE